jgi:pilus assembly protein CpaC
VLGELPILGALFRSADYQQDRTELVFVVTVHLVKPLAPNFSLPTDSVPIPSRAEFLIGGSHEAMGTPAPSAKSTAAPAANISPAGTPQAAATSRETARGFEIK